MNDMSETFTKKSANSEAPSVKVIRDGLRCVLAADRKSDRALTLRKKRSALDETSDEQCILRAEDVAAALEKLKKGLLPSYEYKLLQNSLAKDKTRSIVIDIRGFLRALLRDLKSPNYKNRFIAVGCCCNFALDDESQVSTVLARETGPYLIAGLYAVDDAQIEVCAWTIGNLCANSASAFQILYAQGCMKTLTKIIAMRDYVFPAVLYVLKHCLAAGHDIITDSDVRALTAVLLRFDSFQCDENFVWVLALLSSRKVAHEYLGSAIYHFFQILRMALFSKIYYADLVAPALRLLGNTVTEPSGKTADIFMIHVENYGTVLLFNTLLSYSRCCVQKETLWLLGNLYTHPQPRIRSRTRDWVAEFGALGRFAECPNLFAPVDG